MCFGKMLKTAETLYFHFIGMRDMHNFGPFTTKYVQYAPF